MFEAYYFFFSFLISFKRKSSLTPVASPWKISVQEFSPKSAKLQEVMFNQVDFRSEEGVLHGQLAMKSC